MKEIARTNSWVYVTINDAGFILSKGINVGEKSNNTGDIYYIPSGANFPFKYKFEKIKSISNNELSNIPDDKILLKGDILFNSGGVGTLGRSSYFEPFDKKAVCDGFIIIIRNILKIIDSKFIFYWFQTYEAEILIKNNTKGTTGITSIKASAICNFLIPLPPLNEQKRIVEKLDALMPRIKNTKVRLEKIPVILIKFRQSVLASACSGRLTEDWREGKDIPEWTETILREIADIKGGVTKDSKKQNPNDIEVPYLRVANVQRGHLDLSDVKTIRIPRNRLESFLLKPGDILLNEGGDPDKLGRGWIWENQIQTCSHQNHVFRARLLNSSYEPKYISWFANTIGADFFFQSGKQTTGLASISKTMISNLPILLPPADEQKEIVSRVEKLFGLADSLEAKYVKAIERVEKIEQAVLAKAFHGELAEQDPDDEPAEVLLKRILEEKEKITSPKSKGKKR